MGIKYICHLLYSLSCPFLVPLPLKCVSKLPFSSIPSVTTLVDLDIRTSNGRDIWNPEQARLRTYLTGPVLHHYLWHKDHTSQSLNIISFPCLNRFWKDLQFQLLSLSQILALHLQIPKRTWYNGDLDKTRLGKISDPKQVQNKPWLWSPCLSLYPLLLIPMMIYAR